MCVREKKKKTHGADGLTDTCGVARKTKDRETNLGFSHHLAARSDPYDENELFAPGLFVVGVSDTCIAVRRLGVIKSISEL